MSVFNTTGLHRPSGFQEVEAPRISIQSENEGCKVVSHTHRPSLHDKRDPRYSFMSVTDSTPGAMTNSSNTIGYRSRDLPAWSAVSQPTAPRHVPPFSKQSVFIRLNKNLTVVLVFRTGSSCSLGHLEPCGCFSYFSPYFRENYFTISVHLCLCLASCLFRVLRINFSTRFCYPLYAIHVRPTVSSLTWTCS